MLVSRSDGWVSLTRGLGTTRDKTNDGYFSADTILDNMQINSLYYNDDLSAKIVNKIVKDAFSRGVCFTSQDDPENKIEKKLDGLEIARTYQDALTWARLFGGAIIIVGADDGQTLDMPLIPSRVRRVDWLLVVDKRYAPSLTACTELGPRFGFPETYQVNSTANGATYSAQVHASRCIQIDGEPVDRMRRAQLQGYGQSVLQRPYAVLRDFGLSFKSASIMLADANQGVFSMDGLLEAVASNRQEDVVTRMQLMDMGRSVSRSILLDAQREKFEKVATSFSGVSDMLDRLMMRLSSATGIPVSILMGRSAAGMNATGDLDLETWNKEVQAFQTDISKGLERLFSLCAMPLFPRGAVPSFTAKFPPLGEDSMQTRAAVYGVTATADLAYINAGVLQPQEVAIARFGTGAFSLDAPKIDVSKLEAELSVVVDFEEPPELADAPDVEEPAETT